MKSKYKLEKEIEKFKKQELNNKKSKNKKIFQGLCMAAIALPIIGSIKN